MWEVTITETRKRKVYVDADYDFEAESQVEYKYIDNVINLDDDTYIVKVLYDTKRVEWGELCE